MKAVNAVMERFSIAAYSHIKGFPKDAVNN
jgi:hypothetical protein